jgi:SAM-dependent methyltransferase
VPTAIRTAAARGRFATLRDEALAAALADRLAHDDRTAHLALDVSVSRGVAHLAGLVADREERALVGRLVRSTAGVLAAWDLLALAGDGELAIADVGCGPTKQVPTAVGIDVAPAPGVDVVADVQRGLPFPDASFDHVFAVHVLEHLDDLLVALRELHRVLRPGGTLHVLCPHWRHVNAVADPTHRRLMDVQTFKYVCEPAGRPGVAAWRPLIATQTDDTVHVDLEPVKPGEPAVEESELARWFA